MLFLADLVWIDWLIVGAYGLAVVAIAAWALRRQHSSDDYLMGGRSLPWWLIGMSIIATAFSSISLLGWTGKGYVSGGKWFQLQAGELLAIAIVMVLFLPYFARLRMTTAYEYLEARFGPTSRVIASGMFHLTVLARGGLFLYLTARALHVFVEIDIGWSIVIVGVVAMVYSSLGGLGAVVWTDGLQLTLVIAGVAACIVVVLGELPGGLSDVLASASREPLMDFRPDPGLFPGFWSSLLAYGLLALSVAGTNQQAVQRYMACKDLQASRRAALLSWAIGAGIVLLTLGLGAALHAHWGGRPVRADDVFTTFVRDELPAGLAGMMVAAIFAASMSSIDSTVHSMATATLVDFVDRFRARPLTDARRMRVARTLTLVYGVLAIAAAFYAMRQGRDVIDLLLAWLGRLAGPVLGLFLLGMLTRFVREPHALVGLVCGYLVVVLGFTDVLIVVQTPTGGEPGAVWAWQAARGGGSTVATALGWSDIWAASAGCVATMGVACLLALPSRGRNPVS